MYKIHEKQNVTAFSCAFDTQWTMIEVCASILVTHLNLNCMLIHTRFMI